MTPPLALTVWQPHATMLAIGLRRIETRSWPTNYRGRVLIHAAKKWDDATQEDWSIACEQVRSVPLKSLSEEAVALGKLPWQETLGCVLAVATIGDCIPIPEPCGTEWDKLLGGFGPGRFGFVLTDLHPLREPVPAVGAQKLWTPSEDVLRAVEGAL